MQTVKHSRELPRWKRSERRQKQRRCRNSGQGRISNGEGCARRHLCPKTWVYAFGIPRQGGQRFDEAWRHVTWIGFCCPIAHLWWHARGSAHARSYGRLAGTAGALPTAPEFDAFDFEKIASPISPTITGPFRCAFVWPAAPSLWDWSFHRQSRRHASASRRARGGRDPDGFIAHGARWLPQLIDLIWSLDLASFRQKSRVPERAQTIKLSVEGKAQSIIAYCTRNLGAFPSFMPHVGAPSLLTSPILPVPPNCTANDSPVPPVPAHGGPFMPPVALPPLWP